MKQIKIVYIAHPVGGDVQNNLKKIAKITREICLKTDGIIPVAPYFLFCNALDDNNENEREIGMKLSQDYLFRIDVDELWLYGDKISAGMKKEIELAHIFDIKVVPMTLETQKIYKK